MAVVVTLSKGYDLDYMWHHVGRSLQRDAAGYYIRAAEGGGEPPGRWWGPGARALGFHDGLVVERGPYDLLFGQRKAPDGTRLGRPPGGARSAADLYAQLLAAEPHATAERKRELRVEAAGRARQSPLYFDLTISFSKSISIFHASLGENARLARQAGDKDGEAYWSALVGEVDQMIWDAVYAGFGYFQREAGYTRTGSHARRVSGRETGQWREADLAVAHWLQHTSRDGDMQLHVHSQIAHVARTAVDGKWRAPDSLGYNEHLGAVEAITSQHLEEALTRRFGVDWVARDDGHGFEIQGISGEMMRLFSSRRESINAMVRERARAFESRHGRAPSQRELARIAQASNFATREPKPRDAAGADELHAQWARKIERGLGERLASVAPSVWGERDAGARRGMGLSEPEQRRAAQKALALAQQDKSTWTRADLLKFLGRVTPRTGMDPAAAAALLEQLADRVLAGEAEPVVCLEAPEPAEVPRELLRADGRSVYQRHGGIRYATRAQLSAEEQLVAQAGAGGAPALPPELAARLLGASVTRLDAALARGARGATPEMTRAGLRADQAAAAFWALTDGQRVSVIDAPAGSGKTGVAGAAGRAWTGAGMGRVIGITPSQSARNTLAAGVPESYNAARFLGHLPGQRGALGPVPIGPGDLLVVDETSMISTPDLADIVTLASRSDAKVIMAGDTSQLQAVEGGGGMGLLAERLGYARLAEPVRFAADWERAASLRLRAGDASVLAVYDEHGRITGGEPEEMMDAAARAYIALALDGADVLLIAADHARRRELSRRVRDDLIRLGLVAARPSVPVAEGARASAGDLLVCTRNDHAVEAGEPGRPLANGDLLRVEVVTSRGLVVRRALDPDPVTGQRRWTGRTFLFGNHEDCELGYAVTCHVAQSRTVRAGLALVTGTEDRQHAYVALTRGTHDNHAYVFTEPPKLADPRPGARPAPELERYDRITGQRCGDPAGGPGEEAREQALGALAQVIGRDGQELSATQVREQNLADADHLAILHAIWASETASAREQRYRDLLGAALPPGYDIGDSHKARWLWRTLRAAELAGLDPAGVLRDAVAQRSLADARDVAAVLDSRIRRMIRGLVPLASLPWTGHLPALSDPARREYAVQVARLMDERAGRIGEHAAEHSLLWAVRALGPVPDGPAGRVGWQRRASAIGAYRELYGWEDPADPVGPEPAGGDPDRRAAWHHALAALGPPGDGDVRGLPDGMLHHLRDTYPVDTAWAPQWTGDELRQARLGARQARLAAIRAAAEAAAARRAGATAVAVRQEALAASYQAMAGAYDEREKVFAGVMDDRRGWDRATASRRRLAVAADAELRRRHPGERLPALRSAEPAPATGARHANPGLASGEPVPAITDRITELGARRERFARLLASYQPGRQFPPLRPAEPAPGTAADRIDPAPGQAVPDISERIRELEAGRERFAALLASHQVGRQAGHDDRLSPAFASWAALGDGALLQPPRPRIRPSGRVLERLAERDADREAAG